jgi:hypothetical protein
MTEGAIIFEKTIFANYSLSGHLGWLILGRSIKFSGV